MENETSNSSKLREAPDRSGIYRAFHDPDGPATVSDTVIEAIADVAEVDPRKTVIPISDRIDPDALDALFTDHDGRAQITFHVCGLDVLVRSDGRVRIVDESVGEND